MAEDQNRTLQDKFMLRFPDGMREQLKQEAAKSGRSMNAEIIHRLANSLNNATFSDYALGLGEELDFDLMVSANQNNRTLHEEMVHRLKQSLSDQLTLTYELENQAWNAKKRYEEILSLVMHLTPEERRLLEERAEIMERAREDKISSKRVGDFVRLNPIGGRGRIVLTAPKSDYSPIFGGGKSEKKALAQEKSKKTKDREQD